MENFTGKKMKNIIASLLFLLLAASLIAKNQEEFNYYKSITIEVSNDLEIPLTDALIKIELKKLKKYADFNEKAFIVYYGKEEVPSQLYGSKNAAILFIADFAPSGKKKFEIKYLTEGKICKNYPARTYAELAMKFDAVYKDKKFTSDHFENFSKVVVPEIHTDHDALFKYEGPGWESEKVGYRFYLDWRNATDIFGKKVSKLVLSEVGVNDVTAQDDSYHEMQDWGMDVFKVGNTLGIGSIGMVDDGKISRVEKTEKVVCKITEKGPLLAEVKTTYKGWLIGDKKHDICVRNSISAGSRITSTLVKTSDNTENITTGFAKHEDTEYITSDYPSGWQYIALYGKQSLSGDNLGIVLFYEKSALLEKDEDEINYFVSLKPANNIVEYKYAAAWEQEKDGVKSKEEFKKYIEAEIEKLNNPLNIEVK